MATSYRYDYISVDKYQETPEGYLIIPARIARVGIQEYRRADGTVQREYRPPDEVGSQASLDSFKLKPVTFEHPPTLLNSENVSDYSIGHIGEQVHFDGEYVTANVAVLHKDAVARVKSGEIRELSCGYQVAWDPSPGRTDDGTHYDGCQRAIVGNHVALTKKGRAGPEVRLLMDSADDVGVAVQRLDECECDSCQAGKECPCQDEETPKTRRKRRKMARITIDGAEFEVEDAVAAAVAASQRADATEKDALQQQLDELRADAKKMAKPDPDEEDEGDWEGTDEDPDYAEEDEEEPVKGKRKDRKAAKCDSIAEYEGRLDALYAYIDELEAKANDEARVDADDFEAAVDERVNLIRRAEQVLGADYDYHGRNNREIMEDALSATFDSADLSERSDDYVAAKFDTLLELQSRNDSVRSLERAIAASKPQGNGSDYASGYVSNLTSAWQKPLVAKKEGN